MLVLLGVLSVLTGSFLAIIGALGAIGSGLQLRLLPGRTVTEIAALGEPGDRVVVRGRVAAGPGGLARAPLSGQDVAWYLATQTSGDGDRRSTVDRYPEGPFVLVDGEGRQVLVGPRCPGLEQIAPSWRETRPDPHPWFDEAPDLAPGLDGDAASVADPDAGRADAGRADAGRADAGHADAGSAEGRAEICVYEFTLAEGADVLASGDLGADPAGTPTLTGDVTLSAGGDEAAAGDPARRSLRRDLVLAGAGAALIAIGSVALGVAPYSECEAGAGVCTAGASCDPC